MKNLGLQYAKEVFGDKASILKLGMAWPMPVQKIKEFAANVDRLVVIEELDPFIENHCKALGLKVEGKDNNLLELIAKEQGVPVSKVTKSGRKSFVLAEEEA